MPIHKAPLKSIRADKKKRLRKTEVVSRLKTLEKRFLKLAEENAAEAAKSLEALKSALQKAASKNIIHKNKASRKISRLTRFLNKKSRRS